MSSRPLSFLWQAILSLSLHRLSFSKMLGPPASLLFSHCLFNPAVNRQKVCVFASLVFFFSYWRIMIEASVSGEPLLCFSLSCFVETTLKWRSLALCQDITLFCICATSNSIQALIVISSSVAPASSCPMSAYLKQLLDCTGDTMYILFFPEILQ